MRAETEGLAKDISGVVLSMQFQDITRQRIEHVIEPLLSFKAEFDELQDSIQKITGKIHASDGNGSEEWLRKMYTMESEREAMKLALAKN